MAVTPNEKLPEGNREGGIDAAWDGDDQQWWDWYVTLAENPEAAGELVDGPGLPDVPAASDEEVATLLATPYDVPDDAAARFGRDAFVKLPDVLTRASYAAWPSVSTTSSSPSTAPTPPAGSWRWSRCGSTTT